MQIAFDYAAYQLGVPLGVHWTPGPTSPVHWLIVGPSGTGKTIFSSTLAARMVIHGNAKLWIGSYKDDDFFQFCRREQQPIRYYAFNEAVTAVEEFYHIFLIIKKEKAKTMRIERQSDNIHPDSKETSVKVKQCGNVTEIHFQQSPVLGGIKKLVKDFYIDLHTGEIKKFQHTESRADCSASVARSLARLRDILNCNVTTPENALWITLTYAKNMRDPAQLYSDHKNYFKRLRYYLAKKGITDVEFIAAAEPQARGAWHLHCVLIFPQKAPYIPNKTIARIWGHGYTKTKSLQGIDNCGLYLSAYLGDMELLDAAQSGATHGHMKEVSTTDYEKTVRVMNGEETVNIFNYRQYNALRKGGEQSGQKELSETKSYATWGAV